MKYFKKSLLVAVALFAVNSSANAAPPPYPGADIYYRPQTTQDTTAAHRERITLEFYASKYFTINKKIDRVFVGTKDIIKVTQPADSPYEFVITAQKTKGSTTLFVWTADGARYEYLINVVDEEIGQAEIIQQAIGLPNVHVKKVGDRILLTGKVQNQYERNYALQTAALYVDDKGGSNNLSVGSNVDMTLSVSSSTSSSSNDVETNKLESTGKIIDLLEMINPIQIRLEAQVVGIDSDKAKDLGIQYGVEYTGGIFQFGEDHTRTHTYTEYYRTYGDDGTPSISSIEWTARNTPFRENPARWLEEHFAPINAQITALVNKGDAKILSRPNITTMSGEQATIRIGGQIPYTTTDSGGSKNTEFKDYGIILQFKPVIDAQNRITMAVHTEVSSIDGTTPDGEQYTIATRSADSVVNVHSGSTMVVGGLMDSSESKRVQKIPLLGDIPIIGEFFKYTSKSRDKKELVIVVTPHIVNDAGTNAKMSDEMRDLYHAGQREINNWNDVDLNALPPPFEEDEKDKKKKAKKDKKNKKSDEVVISDYPAENTEDTNYTDDENVEVYGDNY